MRNLAILTAIVFVAAFSFFVGRFYNPNVRFGDFPEIGELQTTGKSCVPGPASATTPASIMGKSVDYSPGDSAGVEVLAWRRTGKRATLLVLEDWIPDDEVAAEGREYELEWREGSWTIVACRAALRYHAGRP